MKIDYSYVQPILTYELTLEDNKLEVFEEVSLWFV